MKENKYNKLKRREKLVGRICITSRNVPQQSLALHRRRKLRHKCWLVIADVKNSFTASPGRCVAFSSGQCDRQIPLTILVTRFTRRPPLGFSHRVLVYRSPVRRLRRRLRPRSRGRRVEAAETRFPVSLSSPENSIFRGRRDSPNFRPPRERSPWPHADATVAAAVVVVLVAARRCDVGATRRGARRRDAPAL